MSRKTQGRRMRREQAARRGPAASKVAYDEATAAGQVPQGQWKMTAHSMAEPRYPLRLSQQVFEVLHPAPKQAGHGEQS